MKRSTEKQLERSNPKPGSVPLEAPGRVEDNSSHEREWYKGSAEDILRLLGSTPQGLTSGEAWVRFQRFGPNVLTSEAGPGIAQLVVKQFQSPLIYMLTAAAAVSFATKHPLDAAVILAVIAVNTVIGVVQEWRAERAIEMLHKLTAPNARVLRDGETTVIPASEVVPGDIVFVEAGDRVPADCRLLSATELFVDESALTGESLPAEKRPVELTDNVPHSDQLNMLWMSSGVTNGHGKAVVVATGMKTELGKISRTVQVIERGRTPLQERLARLGVGLGIVSIALSVLVFVLGLIRGYPVLDILLFAVAMAVAAIPEGLPAVVTVILALGVQKMAEHNSIIRRLPAVETLGSATVICSDKTGTITKNLMTVVQICADAVVYSLSGEYFQKGKVSGKSSKREGKVDQGGCPGSLEKLMQVGILASDAALVRSGSGYEIRGDPSEGAILVAARRLGTSPDELRERYPRVDDIPFSSKTMYMATLNREVETGETIICVKGAPETILAFSSYVMVDGQIRELDAKLRKRIQSQNVAFGRQGLRVLGGAFKPAPPDRQKLTSEDVESGLVFVGLWGMLDPPRKEAVEAIKAARKAGIRVVMITGDHAVTAMAIAKQVGITSDHHSVLSGIELTKLPDEKLRKRVMDISVYARVSPGDKLRIVRALQDRGQIVAMTGDGVNDAPALKQADIGIALGKSGTEVARQAADMVITDDNFATIVKAIEEGRVIFNNLRKVVGYLVMTNLGEILTFVSALLTGLPLPLTAVMVLWVNLATDGVVTIPLGLEKGHGNVLDFPPRPVNAGILDRPAFKRIAILSPVIAVGTLGLFWYYVSSGDRLEHARTIAFTTLVAFQWFQAFGMRSQHSSIFALGRRYRNYPLIAAVLFSVALQVCIVELPAAQYVFRTASLSALDWLLCALTGSSVLVLDELLKALHFYERPSPSARREKAG